MDIGTLTGTTATGGNAFVQGGLTLMLAGAALAYLRAVPRAILSWSRGYIVTTVQVDDSNESFSWWAAWMAQHPSAKRSRRLLMRSRMGTGVETEPAPGPHLLWYRRRPIFVYRHRRQLDNASGANSFAETLYVTIPARSKAFVTAFLEDVRAAGIPKDEKQVKLYTLNSGGQAFLGRRPARSVDTVILPGDTAESVVADAAHFTTSRDWYASRGVPWRRGYLFHGAPGTGKTSLIMAVASELGYDVVIPTLAQSDQEFARAMACLTSKDIVVFEDIDCLFDKRAKSVNGEQRHVTFSGFLNAMDGFIAPDGLVVFMTSNHVERLDPALLRPGRCDVRIEFGPATADQASRMFARFYPDAPTLARSTFGEQAAGASMAAIQEALVSNADDYHGALSADIAGASDGTGSGRTDVAA